MTTRQTSGTLWLAAIATAGATFGVCIYMQLSLAGTHENPHTSVFMYAYAWIYF